MRDSCTHLNSPCVDIVTILEGQKFYAFICCTYQIEKYKHRYEGRIIIVYSSVEVILRAEAVIKLKNINIFMKVVPLLFTPVLR